MPLHRRGELQAFLDILGRGAKRTLSQNFLVDGNIVQKIVSLSSCVAGESLIEIGPGPGVLTEAFVSKGVRPVAIELDSDFARSLPRLGDLTVYEADVRTVSFSELIPSLFSEQSMVHIVSNLPYHLTKEILLKIASECRHPCEAVLMVQEEVARKLTNDPISSSLLAMELHMYGELEYAASVSKRCFYPEPKVDSAILKFRSHVPLIQDPMEREKFLAVLRIAYQHRRKAIAGLLSKEGIFSKEYIEKSLEKMELSLTSRPDDLSFDKWLVLFRNNMI